MSDSTLTFLVYLQALIMLFSGALIIANVRLGGLGLFISMAMMVATRDNPALAVNEHTARGNFINMLKDLGVAGMGLLIYFRKQTVKHRHQNFAPIEETDTKRANTARKLHKN